MTKKSLSQKNGMELEKIIPSFHIEADGRGKRTSLLISGVTGVKSFSDNETLLSTKGESILVFGEGLLISVLELKRISISGKIRGISFLDKRAKKNENR